MHGAGTRILHSLVLIGCGINASNKGFHGCAIVIESQRSKMHAASIRSSSMNHEEDLCGNQAPFKRPYGYQLCRPCLPRRRLRVHRGHAPVSGGLRCWRARTRPSRLRIGTSLNPRIVACCRWSAAGEREAALVSTLDKRFPLSSVSGSELARSGICKGVGRGWHS